MWYQNYHYNIDNNVIYDYALIVQQTEWDKGSILRDTSTGGTTFSNLYQINEWSI